MNRMRITLVLLGCFAAAVLGIAAAALTARSGGDSAAGPSPVVSVQATPEIGPDATGLPVLFSAPSFALIDQDQSAFTDQRLRGHPYIVDFIFTHCGGPCPVMTGKMAQLQEKIASQDVKLVSFSVDPERDRPDVLKAYGKTFDARPGRWYFLTTPEGGHRTDIFAIARGFKLAAGPATDDAPIFHSEKFLLVDGAGQVRGIYSSNDPADLEKLARDAGELASARDAAR